MHRNNDQNAANHVNRLKKTKLHAILREYTLRGVASGRAYFRQEGTATKMDRQ